MESPELCLIQFVFNDQLFDLMLGIIGQTERVQGSFFGLENIFKDIFFAHAHIVVRGANFFPVGCMGVGVPFSGLVSMWARTM